MKEEMATLEKNETWLLVKFPKGKRAICRWMYAQKEDLLVSQCLRHNARMVAKGYAQKKCIDYNKVFLLVVKYTSIWILLAFIT